MHFLSRGRRPAALLLVLAGAFAGACDDLADNNPLAGATGTGPSDMIYADPAIDQGDTYYLTEVWQEGSTEVNSSLPITDPETGAVSYTKTWQHQPELQRVEGGYDYYGRIIQVLDQTDAMADPLATPVNTTRRTRSVEETLTRYDTYQQPLSNELQPQQPYGMGNGPSHEQITDGLMLDAAAVDGLQTLSPEAEALAPAAGPRAKVNRAGPDEIRITNPVGVDAPASGEPRGQYVRTYRRRGHKYILEQAELTASREAEGTVVRERQVTRIKMLRYHENPRKDRERRERGRMLASSGATVQVIYEPACPLSTGPGTTLGTLGAVAGPALMADTCTYPEDPPPPPPPPADPCPKVTTGPNVLFQHGIMSSGDTWWRMDPWIRCSIRTNEHIRPGINWFNRIDSQRDELKAYFPYTPTVLVGHSNGGLVSRALAQWAQTNRPGALRGVVTLDSPNQGAIVARNAQALETIIGTLLFGSGWILFDIVKWHPFYEDDVPNSAFLQRTNNFNETFTRAGIQTHAPKRWVAWRILKTDGNCTPESYCGERAVARQTQEAYDRHRHYARFWYRPWQSIPAAASMLTMNGLDAVWNGLTAPSGRTTDGFIHGDGQVYPRALRNSLILNGDSHVGTTRSPFVRTELEKILKDPVLFNIPAR
ncbi:MAG TPA: alpha/beta hydrolase [Longimicrobium sp.]